jgi:hypothetical protein
MVQDQEQMVQQEDRDYLAYLAELDLLYGESLSQDYHKH